MAVRIASVSDLHVDFAANRNAVVRLATEIHRRQADLVVVAGDVSHVDDHIARTVRAFKVAAPRVAYLPGNHDLWFVQEDARDNPKVDSWRRYRVELKALVEAEGCHYLPDGPLRIGSIAVAGVTGWYDSSMLRPEILAQVGPDAVRAKAFGGAVWSDARFAVFRDEAGAPMSDAAVARRMEQDLSQQLETLDAEADITDVVVATHVLGFTEALGPPKGMPWDYFDAFMGSLDLGKVVRSSRKVRAAIYGHTHRPGAFEVGGIRVHGTPLGYPRERRKLDPETIPERAIGWIEL